MYKYIYDYLKSLYVTIQNIYTSFVGILSAIVLMFEMLINYNIIIKLYKLFSLNVVHLL